jgi:rare lipoprotein A
MMALSVGKPGFITRHFVLAALLAAMMTGGCGTVPKRDSSVSKAPPARGGGYYLDDGPGANPPADLDAIPDAVPRREALHRGASRPYTVMGRDYTPMTSLGPYRARGVATWYGRRYHGKATSIGEPYDMYAMTAAHTTLPIPSYARVTHLASGRSVVVRVNDRGPFVGDRLIDLSYAAAHRLGVVATGSTMVEVESIVPGIAPPVLAENPAPSRQETASTAPAPEVAAAAPLPVPEVPILSDAGGVYLQLGAFGSKDNAENFLARLMLQVDWLADRLSVFSRDGFHRVRAGPYPDSVAARRIAERVSETLGIRPVMLTQ